VNAQKERDAQMGMVTVETAVVFPLLFALCLILIGLLFFFCRWLMLQSIVDDALKRAALASVHPASDFRTGALTTADLQCEFLFSKALTFFSDPFSKHAELRQKLDAELATALKGYRQTVHRSGEVEVHIQTEQCFIFKRLRIELYDSRQNAFSNFYTYFGTVEPRPLATGEVLLKDTPEMIRTVDLASDLIDDTPVIQTYKNALGKVRETLLNFVEHPGGE
jgi:hypothetical protein